MPQIVIGEGMAQTLLEVSKVPKLGDRITIRLEQILEVATENAYLMVDDTFVLTSESTIKVKDQVVPWFGIRNVKYAG